MTDQQIFEKVVKIVTPFARNTDALRTISPETRVLEDLQVNSARLVDIVIAFEDEFQVAIDDQSVDQVRSIGDIVRMIQDRAKQQSTDS